MSYENSLDALLTILNSGGKITQAPCHLSRMLNGLRYYSIEVTINGDHFLIQAFEQEASDLFQAVMSILGEKKIDVIEIEVIFREPVLLGLNSFHSITDQKSSVRLLSFTCSIQSIANKRQ